MTEQFLADTLEFNNKSNSTLITQPQDITANNITTTATKMDVSPQSKKPPSKKRKSKLKKAKKSVLEVTVAEERAKIMAKAASSAPVTPAANNNGTIDLCDSPSPSKVQGTGAPQQPQQPKKAASSVSKITPASNRVSMDSCSGNKEEDTKKRKSPSPSSYEGNNDEVVVAPTNKRSKSHDTAASTAKQPTSNAPKSDGKSNSSNDVKPAAAATTTAAAKPPTKKKKRSFNDDILYKMLTTCKPYSIKSLAKATDSTSSMLSHVMLSFLDKKTVLCKEFPSKKGEPKKLYWANPMSLSEMENGGSKGKGGGAVVKELSKLLTSPQELEEVKASRQQLERQYRAIQEELTPLLAIPTMKELDDQILAEEEKLKGVQNEIDAMKERIANVSKPAASSGGGGIAGGQVTSASHHYFTNRFKPTQSAEPQSPKTLKRKINHFLGEYKARKRKCMDFVGELSEAMEKKAKDVVGDKLLGLDTDEMEWGCYEDGATGKVYGTMPKQQGAGKGGLLGKKNNGSGNDGVVNIVKIPAKYENP